MESAWIAEHFEYSPKCGYHSWTGSWYCVLCPPCDEGCFQGIVVRYNRISKGHVISHCIVRFLITNRHTKSEIIHWFVFRGKNE